MNVALLQDLSPVSLGVTGLAAAIAAAYVGLVALGVRGRVRGIKPLPALLMATVNPGLAPVLACWALGDALLLDKDRYFLHGLGAFLIGHIWFIALIGLNTGVSVPALLFGVALAVGMLTLLWPGLRPKLRRPVALYALALAGVLGVAGPGGSLAGAAVFMLSDTILAWNRFRTPLPRGDLLVMVTYYSAVFLIALGCR